jgi:hypothetical protein
MGDEDSDKENSLKKCHLCNKKFDFDLKAPKNRCPLKVVQIGHALTA